MSDHAHNPPYRYILGDPSTHYQVIKTSPDTLTKGFPYPQPNGFPPNSAQPFDYVRRIIDLETKVAKLEAAIAKLTGETT